MADKIRVAAEELHARARWIEDQAGDWPTEVPTATAPDGLQSTKTAVDNLNAYGVSLQEYTNATKEESLRLAKTLRAVANAYEAVDQTSADAIERLQRVEAIPVPQPLPEPQLPSPAPRPQLVSAAGYGTVPQTEELLNDPGDASSLSDAGSKALKTAFAIRGGAPDPNFHEWEGDAAEAAFSKFNGFRDWIDELAAGWAKYTAAAKAVFDAHTAAVAAHHPIWQEYDNLQRHLDDLLSGTSPDQAEVDRILNAMEAEEQKSVDVRETYAQKAGVNLAPLPEPPFGARAGTEHPDGAGAGAEGGGAGTGGSPSGLTAGEPAMSTSSLGPAVGQPQPEPPTAAGTPSGAGAPSGGGPPSGGGAPAGGTPGGLPGGQTGDMPKASEPKVKPVSVGGGGTGGGGVGGGGAGTAPLEPAVTAETVAPGAAAARGGPAPVRAAPGGAMMGGMGGPMMGGQGQNPGKEKRRDPALSPDEDLYKEDRPWTEGIIGNRRRKDPKDVKGRQETGSS